ncbi:MAG: AAA family ATPase [Candidatus Bathyarchaeia archaeon]|jgi:energy-coupling factor transporter ATP-binding protein EcfA2
MFVDSIDIKEFRGIEHCKTPLSLSKFTVLIGRNNSGKSSVLEALSLLPHPSNTLAYTSQNRLGFVEKLHGGRTSMVYGYSGTSTITYNLKGKIWTLHVSDNENSSASLEIDGVSTSDIYGQIANALNITKLGDFISKINDEVFFIPTDSTFVDSMFSKLNTEQYRNIVTKSGANVNVAKELVNKCVDDKYTEILFAPDLSARKERGEGRSPLYVKVKDLGAGIEKTVIITLWLEAQKPSLVLWDDFEGSAHPALIKVLLEWLSKKPWQVVMSTHSIDVLTSLLEVRPKETKVIQLKKTDSDVLLHEDLTLEQLEDVVETSQDPRKLVDFLKL